MLAMVGIGRDETEWLSLVVLYQKKCNISILPELKLNAVTIRDSYSLPGINECMNSLWRRPQWNQHWMVMGWPENEWFPMKIMAKPRVLQSPSFSNFRMSIVRHAAGVVKQAKGIRLSLVEWQTALVYLACIVTSCKSRYEHTEHVWEVFKSLVKVRSSGDEEMPELYDSHMRLSSSHQYRLHRSQLLLDWPKSQLTGITGITKLASTLAFAAHSVGLNRILSELQHPSTDSTKAKPCRYTEQSKDSSMCCIRYKRSWRSQICPSYEDCKLCIPVKPALATYRHDVYSSRRNRMRLTSQWVIDQVW